MERRVAERRARSVVRTRRDEHLRPAVAAEREQRVERRPRDLVTERREVDDLAAVAPADAARAAADGEDAEARHRRRNATLARGRAPRSGSM